jgi:putative transposase
MEPKNDPTRRIIQIDEGLVQSQVTQMVKETVEETLNAMLDAEADRLIQAEKYFGLYKKPPGVKPGRLGSFNTVI